MANPAPLILIVDDEAPIRRLVHTSLNDEGYRVAEAESGNRPFASPLNSRPTSSFSTSAYRT